MYDTLVSIAAGGAASNASGCSHGAQALLLVRVESLGAVWSAAVWSIFPQCQRS